MAEQKPDGLDTNPVTIALQRVYLKDSSFEAPNSPAVFSGEWGPNVSLNIASKTNDMGDGVYECVLHLTAEAKQGDKTAFLAEVEQGGLFVLRGLSPADLQRALVTFCPQQLYPYAREVIADLTSKGGFPALQLQPMNFEAIAAEAQRRQQAEQAAAAESPGAAPEASQ
ncbi:MAG: protein-export chaperone SecB [Gammaproteobacteria bacterium]|jgi:preprotein translocase subunit SecB